MLQLRIFGLYLILLDHKLQGLLTKVSESIINSSNVISSPPFLCGASFGTSFVFYTSIWMMQLFQRQCFKSKLAASSWKQFTSCAGAQFLSNSLATIKSCDPLHRKWFDTRKKQCSVRTICAS